jgi:hypothetical protein
MQTHQKPDSRPNYVQHSIVVKSVASDDASWAWSTLQNLVPDELTSDQNPGDESIIETGFKFVMEHASRGGINNAYANPAFCVSANTPSMQFFLESRRAQAQWFQQVREILGASGRVKRAVREMTPIVRQLSHTGVLVVDGKHVLPNLWPDRRDEQKQKNVAGHRFGRLVVMKMLKRSSCLCRCDCGRETVVRRSHLIKGGTRSCGCLKSEFEARQKKHKDKRRWIHSQQLRTQN